MILRRKTLTFRTLGGKIDITDPSYSKNSIHRINDLVLPVAKYGLSYYKGDDLEKEDIKDLEKMYKNLHVPFTQERIDKDKQDIRTRIFRLEILREDLMPADIKEKWKKIGTIGVDSGMAGIFWGLPYNFTEDEWNKFCDNFNTKWGVKADKYGFYSYSGYGDGIYEVKTIEDNGNIIAIRLDF